MTKFKNRTRVKPKKIAVKFTLIVAVALVVTFILFMLASGRFGDWVVSILQNRFLMDYDSAIMAYHLIFRRNMRLIIIGVIVVFIIIFSRFLFVYEKKKAEQRKNDLIAYLAHDIKTPLTSVMGYLSLLSEASDMPSEQRVKYVNIGLEKAYRLESLINEFFEITQYNLQTIALSKKDIDLHYMLVQLADEAFPQLNQHGKKAVIHAAEDLTVHGDPDKLARAFNNILKNAVSYGEANSDIDISASTKKGKVIVEFRNVGSIPKDKLKTIFDKFYRLDEARSSDTGGAGLGLAISKEIIVAHGGKIKATSENNYTTFAIELPVKKI